MGGGLGGDLDHPLAVEFRLLPQEDMVQVWGVLHCWKYVASWMVLCWHYLDDCSFESTGCWISLSIFEEEY